MSCLENPDIFSEPIYFNSNKKIIIDIYYDKENKLLSFDFYKKESFFNDIPQHRRRYYKMAFAALEEDLKNLFESLVHMPFNNKLISDLNAYCSNMSYRIYKECGVTVEFNLSSLRF